MCGIAGFWQRAGAGESASLERTAHTMARAIAHRGPDDSGAWCDAASGVALSHRRLSILDLSPLGHQPMESACQRFVIVFNGEIYNHRSLRKELARSGHRFRGGSDTETMLAAFAEWGVEPALRRFNGMFAFGLWDRAMRQLHLARDRAGEKPLYIARCRGSLLFASEIKALRAHPDFESTVDRNALALYMRHGYVPAPHSIYRDVAKLPPATLLTLSHPGDAATPYTYWSFEEAAARGAADPFDGSDQEAATVLEELLRDAVRLRMEADVPLGAFLSGGIDSSTVVALMQAQSSRPVRTFTIGFHESGYNEAEQASRVARHLGTEHTELYLTPGEATAVIPQLPRIYDEPFADSSQIPTFLVSQLARRHVTVSLSGDAGDELFGGYTRYLWATAIWRQARRLPAGARRWTARSLTALPADSWSALLHNLDPFLPATLRQHNPGDKIHKLAEVLNSGSAQQLYLGLVSQWKDPPSVVPGAVEPPRPLTDPASWPRQFDFAQQMMYFDTLTYLPDDILVKIDRASMAVGLEARVPLLDHRLIEFAWKLPTSLRIRNGVGKWLLRQVLYRHVPPALVERPKMGFGIPIETWLRRGLRPWAEELLDEGRLRREGFFDPAPIRQKWTEHLEGRRNWQYYLWNVLMFEAWLEETRQTSTREAEASSAVSG